jgi:hypothetical protein
MASDQQLAAENGQVLTHFILNCSAPFDAKWPDGILLGLGSLQNLPNDFFKNYEDFNFSLLYI